MNPPDKDATDAQHFGFVLWTLRSAAGLSRAKVAKLARLSEATIKGLEAGHRFPSPSTLYRLMSVPQLRLTPELVKDLFAVSSLVHVDYEVERQMQITPECKQISVRLALTFKDKKQPGSTHHATEETADRQQESPPSFKAFPRQAD